MSYQIDLTQLSPNVKEWLLYGITGIVIADGIVVKNEMVFLKTLCEECLKKESAFLERMANCIIEKQLPGKLPENKFKSADEIFFVLDKFIETIYADQVYDQQEKNFFRTLCIRMGLKKEDVKERMEIEYIRRVLDPNSGEKGLEQWYKKVRTNLEVRS